MATDIGQLQVIYSKYHIETTLREITLENDSHSPWKAETPLGNAAAASEITKR